MASEDRRQSDLASLHPAIRDKVVEVKSEVNKLGFSFEIFEAYRSPQRQAYLYAQGRTRPGKIVTKAQAWSSYHQYGLAADFVLKTNGNWDWNSSGSKAEAWRKLHEVARAHGLEPLSWELPHLQMAGLKISDLRGGRFPVGGDESWATNLEAAIVSWRGSPSSPPAPHVSARPPIPEEFRDQDDATRAGSGQPKESVLPGDFGVVLGDFETVHSLIEKWEGGFDNDPDDPGGPTNMGITQAVLAEWRGHPVSVADVRNLTRDEALKIFRARYWAPIKGDELPLPAAQVVYNTCVLSGRGRAVRILQEALNRQNAQVNIDGRIGDETIRACCNADQAKLVADYCAAYERYLRSLPHFTKFGRGWMNRLNEIKAAAARWASGRIGDAMAKTDTEQTRTDLVEFGDRGARVKALQESLTTAGYTIGDIDGIFGSLTRAAVLAFQADNDLPTTGVADRATWRALDSSEARPLIRARVAVTADDLRAKGSETVKSADRTKIAGWLGSILGALGIGNSAVVQIANNTPSPAGPPPNLAQFLTEIQQFLGAPTATENQAKVGQLLEAAQQLQNFNAKSLLSPENLKVLEQIRALVPQDVINANPAIADIFKQIDAAKPQLHTIFDVLPGFFANDSVMQMVSKGLAIAAGSVIPGFGGSLAVLGIGLAANYFSNNVIKARVKDHATAANTNR